MHTFKRIVVS